MATNQEYKNLNYDRLAVWIPKGRREQFKAKAAALGLSLAQMIQRAVEAFGTATEMSAEPAAEMSAENVDQTCSASRADETPPQPAETTENGASGEGIPIIPNGVDHTAQNQPVSKQVQTIEATAEGTPNRITAADKRLFEAVNALSPESKKSLLKFLQTLQA